MQNDRDIAQLFSRILKDENVKFKATRKKIGFIFTNN